MEPPSTSEPPRPVTESASDDLQPAFDTVHLARFEFSDKGTKVLMVEWQPGVVDGAQAAVDTKPDGKTDGDTKVDTDKTEDSEAAPNTTAVDSKVKDTAGWEVSWPGKSTQLPARDVDQDGAKRRVYFLLPHEAPIPPTVSITKSGSPSITLKPLPAIFPEGFDVEAGTCGVLHTLWAKKRLSELDREIAAEMRNNAEGIGLQMVIAEREWISDTFLTPPRPVVQHPITPRSPIGGRLGLKLKGLKLGTSPEDLIPSPTANTFTGRDVPSHTLSPTGDDIAMPSFSAMPRGENTMSLAAIANDDLPPNRPASKSGEDDLFALPMSPRSPDMKKSPFSAL